MIIKTKTHYLYTQRLKAQWEKDIRDLRANPPVNMSPERVEGECRSMEYTIGEFKQQLQDYEAVRDGKFDPDILFRSGANMRQTVHAFAHELLIARLASGVTEEAMATHLGLSLEDLRKLEEGEYKSADLEMLLRASDLLTGGADAVVERELAQTE